MKIEELVIEGAGQSFKGIDFRQLLNPGVYILLKNEQPIYIGMGNRLIYSLSRHKSHYKRTQALEQCDQILVYPCKSVAAAKELESMLISAAQPKHNSRGKSAKIKQLLGIRETAIYETGREEQQETNHGHL